MIEREANNLHQVIDILHLKQKEYADIIQTRTSGDSTDHSEIRRITGMLMLFPQVFVFYVHK